MIRKRIAVSNTLRLWVGAALSVILLMSFQDKGPGTFEKILNGVIVYPDAPYSSQSKAVRLEVVSDYIIKVSASAQPQMPSRKSLITVYNQDTPAKWQLLPGKEKVTLTTNALLATVMLKTGVVSFTDRQGKPLLAEKRTGGRKLEKAIFDGQPLYHITQQFQTTPDDAYYGLGQHQDDVFNYKGEQVSFFQNNTEVAIPFLVSNKGYGILWDNYSLTLAGDIRPYHPLNALQLFSKNGDEGWWTATYSNDKEQPENAVLQQAVSAIDYEFLGDSKRLLPEVFQPAKGVVTYEGSVASGMAGMHKFRFTYGGYIKVWINNKLVLDRWRKAWNPAPAVVNVDMKPGESVPVKIEWIPEGTESYLSLKWLEPPTPADKDVFGFSSEAGQLLDYYFIYGHNMDDVISGYRYITGKATIVPKWAMGFWQSRERYKTEDEILTTIAEFRKRHIPIDNIVLDWSYWKEAAWGSQEFDEARFPSPDSMTAAIHNDYHAHIMISVWPKFYEGIPAYNDFEKKGWLYKRNIADRQRDWIGKGYISTFYDAFNTKARKGFWDLISKKIYSKGFDAWWMDASEPDILSNVSPEKRKLQMTPTALGPAAAYLNAYPLENAKGIYEGQRSVDPDKRVFLLTRSGFAGSQHYGAAIWSGDIGARWQDMKAQITAGLNFSMSGIPYWTMDIGGFVVENRYEHPNDKDLEEWREQMTRWYQFGAFVPLFRSHGQFPYREVFNLAPEAHPAYQSILYYDKLRYRLMPYIYSLAGATYHHDYTIMRGLAMDFGTDPKVLSIGNQYMFGPSLLINPVYTYQADHRPVYLPATTGWYDLYSGTYYKGGQTITAAAPYERMPVYVKEGSILPFGPSIEYTGQKAADTITLVVYTGKDSKFALYEDEDTTYQYEKGQYTSIPISYQEASKTVFIGKRQGSFPGMLRHRTFRIIEVSPSRSRPLDVDGAADKTVIYDGKALIIKL